LQRVGSVITGSTQLSQAKNQEVRKAREAACCFGLCAALWVRNAFLLKLFKNEGRGRNKKKMVMELNGKKER